MPASMEIFDKLFEQAKTNEKIYGARIYAGIAKRNKLLVSAPNSHKSHPFQLKFLKNPYAIYLHAEIHATIKALRGLDEDDLGDCDLYIARARIINNNERYKKNKKFSWGYAKPCPGCLKMIEKFNIKNVYYTTDTQNVIEIL